MTIFAKALDGVPPLLLARTLALTTIGGGIAWLIGMPAPLLIGAMIVSGVLAFMKAGTRLPAPLVNTAFILMGMLLGSNVSEDTLELVAQWPWSMAAVAVGLFIMVGGTTLMMTKIFKLDPITAYLASVPGHLSMVTAMATSGMGDASRIITIQSVRLLSLTLVLPILAMIFGWIPDATTITPPAAMDLTTLLVLGVLCTLSGLALDRLNVPAPMILGPMIVTIIGKLGGLYHGVLPDYIAAIGLVVVGTQIGNRLTHISPNQIRRDLISGLAMTAIMIGFTVLFAALLTLVMDLSFGQIWFGLAPGGLETIGALGLALGYDTAFIAAHQTWRLLILGLAIPLGPIAIKRANKAN